MAFGNQLRTVARQVALNAQPKTKPGVLSPKVVSQIASNPNVMNRMRKQNAPGWATARTTALSRFMK